MLSTGGVNPPSGNPAGGANPAGNQGANLGGNPNQGAGSNINGPLNINDPLNQSLAGYNPKGTNQPFARNLASALEHQSRLAGGTMSKYVVNPRDEQFLLSHLLYHERDLYDKAMNPSGHDDSPRW